MADCPDKQFQSMRHAYELGLLTDDERYEFEMHLLDCPACRESIREFQETINLIRQDGDIREMVENLDREEEAASEEIPEKLQRTRRRLLPTLIPATVLALVVVFLLVLKPWQIEISPTQIAIAAENRLAIMYFDNITDPDDSQRLGQILTNLLITDLAESRWMQVVSHQHMYDILKHLGVEDSKRIDSETATRVAAQANARWMLMGSILQVEPQLIVTAQLVEVKTGNVVASQRVTGEIDEAVFSLVDKLSAEIKNDLSLPAEARNEIDRPVADVTTHAPEAYRLYLDGVTDYNNFYMDDAIAKFRKALDYDSTFAMAYYYLAIIGESKLIDKAIKFAANASHKEKQLIASRARVFAGDTPGAIEILKELVKWYPDEKSIWNVLGIQYYSQRKYNESAAALEEAIAIDPLYSVAYNQLAYTYNARGDFEKAIEAINNYIALVPDEANPYDSRAEIYASNGKIDEAIESYQMALEKRPDFLNSRRQLAYLCIYGQDYEKAGDYLQDCLAMSDSPKEQMTAREALVYIPLYQGKFEQALMTLDDGIAWIEQEKGDEGTTAFRHLKSYIYSEMGDYKKAMAEMETCIEISRKKDKENKYAPYLDLYIELLAKSGDFDKAQQAADSFKTLLTDMPKKISDYWYARGTIELYRGNHEAAIEFLNNSDSLAPAYSLSIHYMLGQAYLKAGMFEKTIVEYEMYLEHFNVWRLYWGIWSVKSYYYLGLAYEGLGEREKAADNYRTFLDIWENADAGIPEIDDATERLSRLQAKS